MPFSNSYTRGVTLLGGLAFDEYYIKLENSHNDTTRTTFRLLHTNEVETIFEKSWNTNILNGEVEILRNDMPEGWVQPMESRIAELCSAYTRHGDWQTLQAYPPAYIYAVKLSDDRLVLSKRPYTDMLGDPFEDSGKLTAPCGEAEWQTEISDTTILKVFEQQFDLMLTATDYTFLGEVYEPQRGRLLHMCHVTAPLDVLKNRSLVEDLENLIGAMNGNISLDHFRAYAGHLTSPDDNQESLGQVSIYAEDLDAAIAAGDVTDATVKMLSLYPQLRPRSKVTFLNDLKLDPDA